MKTFKISALSAWSLVSTGQIYEFDSRGSRRISFDVNSNGRIDVWASYNQDMKDRVLLGSSEGQFNVNFTAERDCYVAFSSVDPVDVFMRGTAPEMRVAARTDLEVYTMLAPRNTGDDAFKRMAHLMRMNQEAFKRDMQKQIDRLQAVKSAPQKPSKAQEVIDPNDEPETKLEEPDKEVTEVSSENG